MIRTAVLCLVVCGVAACAEPSASSKAAAPVAQPLSAEPVTASIPLTREIRKAIQTVRSTDPHRPTLILRLKGLAVPDRPDVSIQVFLNNEKVQGVPAGNSTDDPRFVGSVFFYGARNKQIDTVMDLEQPLRAVGDLQASNLSVTLVATQDHPGALSPIVLEAVEIEARTPAAN